MQVRNVVTTCLEKILVERAPSEAREYVKGIISELLMNKLDLSLLVISKVRQCFYSPLRHVKVNS
jgi:DNA polymerase delta subunit 1